jgi:hypothetical protein
VNRLPFVRCLTAVLLAVALISAGCVMAHNRTRKEGIVPAQALNLSTSQPPLVVMLHSVIVHDGPGAWKEMTWWDEYVISVTNQGDAPLTLEAAELVDYAGQASAPGNDPWKLEREGQQWWDSNAKRKLDYAFALGVGTYGAAGVAFLGGAAATGTMSGAAAAATVVIAAVPVAIIGTVALNSSQRHKIEAEFHRRRLALPATLAPGATRTGSLFFRLSPGPQRLALHYRAGEQSQVLALPLTPLAALHFKKRIYASPPAAEPAASKRDK